VNFNLDMNNLIGSAIPMALIGWIMYRRIRRNFGRQRLRRGWMIFRLVVFSVIAAVLLPFALFSAGGAAATVLGAGFGVALAMWAAKRTRFLKDNERLFYIPHTYTGLVVSALFLGRFIYKIWGNKSLLGAVFTSSDPSLGEYGGWGSLASNPLTRALFYAYVGYYIYYYVYVLHESKHLKPEDWEQPDAGRPAVGQLPMGSGHHDKTK